MNTNLRLSRAAAIGLAAVASLTLPRMLPAQPNVADNPGFEVVGPLGSYVVTTTSDPTSAAKNWWVFRPVPTTIITQLLKSTDPFPGGDGNMMQLTTKSGNNGSAANGLFCTLLASVGVGAVGILDVNAPAGSAVMCGFVNAASGGFDAGSVLVIGTGTWQRVLVTVQSGATSQLGVEIFSAGATIELDAVYAGEPKSASTSIQGKGCAGKLGIPDLHANTLPVLGSTFQLEMSNAWPGLAFLVASWSGTSWGGFPLPMSLGWVGLSPVCFAHAGVDVSWPVVHSGTASWPIPLPLEPSYYGVDLYWQGWAMDPTVTSPQPFVVSNGLRSTLGS